MQAAQIADDREPPATPAPKSNGLLEGIGWKAGLIALILGWSVAGGLLTAILQSDAAGPNSGDATTTPTSNQGEPSQPTNFTFPDDLQLVDADDLLLAGETVPALKAYITLGERNPTSTDLQLECRLALAHELAQHRDQAITHYQRLAISDYETRNQLADIFQARATVNRGRPAVAQPLLARVLLEATDPRLRAEADHLYAQAAAKEAHVDRQVLKLGVLPPRRQPKVKHSLWLIDTFFSGGQPQPEPKNTEAAAGVRLLSSFGKHPEEMEFAAYVSSQQVFEFVENASREGKVAIEWTPVARQIIQGRTVTAAMPRATLARLLDFTIGVHGLVWRFETDVVRIAGIGELSSQEADRWRLTMADRSLRQAASTHPESSTGDETIMWLANLAFITGEYATASSYYDQLLRQYPDTDLRSQVRLNFGKSLLYEGRLSDAQREFYWVADQTRGLDLEAPAYLFLARTFLESTASGQAIQPSRRAVSLAVDSATKRTAVLTLVSAYLLDANPNAALLELSNHSKEFPTGADRNHAAFLSALARYQVARGDRQLERTGHELIAAASLMQPREGFGGFGYWLLGDALRDIGLLHQAAEIYERGVKEQPAGPMQYYLQLQLAEAHVELGDVETGVAELVHVAQSEQAPWAVAAQLRIIEMKLEEGETEWCLEASRRLLGAAELPEHRAQLLKVMGDVYQRKRDHYRAALCFSGLMPPDDSQPAADDSAAPTPSPLKTP